MLAKLQRISRILLEAIVAMALSDMHVLLEFYFTQMAQCPLQGHAIKEMETKFEEFEWT